jgi:hypothetical protein
MSRLLWQHPRMLLETLYSLCAFSSDASGEHLPELDNTILVSSRKRKEI